jgi:transposase
LAHFVSELVDGLDLSATLTPYEDDERGYPPDHPVMLTKVLLYAWCAGVFSSRRIERRRLGHVAFRLPATGHAPVCRTIAEFSRRHLDALQSLSTQVLRVMWQAGALQIGRGAIDDSKVKANAPTHTARSCGRMREREAELKQEVHRLLTQAAAIDAQEDAQHGRDRRSDDLPADLQRRTTRLARTRKARRVLEARVKEAAEARRVPLPDAATPDEKAQYNLTEPESRIRGVQIHESAWH